MFAGVIAFAIAATGLGVNAQSASAAGTTITIWHNLGTTQNAEAVKALTSA
jgi:ABC-type glycerol-3-phosphate transport system substrate-binding protein